jgi:hypothetical protein
MKPEVDQEIKDAMKIYKIAGPIIIIILLIGIFYAVLQKEPAPQPVQQPIIQPPASEQPPAALPEPTPAAVPINTTPANVTTTQPVITQNTTNATSVPNITIVPTPIPAPQVANLTWETITVTFPDTMKRIGAAIRSHQYIEILEGDGTPITNGEQFDLSFIIEGPQGKDAEVIPSFESNKWLITILLTNRGIYTLTVDIKCADKTGHCRRLYPEGSIQKSTSVEIV